MCIIVKINNEDWGEKALLLFFNKGLQRVQKLLSNTKPQRICKCVVDKKSVSRFGKKIPPGFQQGQGGIFQVGQRSLSGPFRLIREAVI
jgi:hypothetical protein